MAAKILLALSTFPDTETARRISNQLVTEKFAACANILPAVESIYRWKEKIETAGEMMYFSKPRRIDKKLFRKSSDHFIRTTCRKYFHFSDEWIT